MKTHEENNNTIMPPYPRLGEVYRKLAVALDTKTANRDIDHLAREGEYNWKALSSAIQETISTPLEKYIDAKFAKYIYTAAQELHDEYIGCVMGIALDHFTRKEALPVLEENIFIPFATHFIYQLNEDFEKIDMPKFLTSESPIDFVITCMESNEENDWVNIAYPSSSDNDKQQKDKIRRWRTSKELPSLQGIKLFADDLSSTGKISPEKIEALKYWLVLARAITFFEKESTYPIRQKMLQYALSGFPIDSMLKDLINKNEAAGQKNQPLVNKIQWFFDNLNLDQEKEQDAQSHIKQELKQFKHDLESQNKDHLYGFYASWFEARWHALSSDFLPSLSLYKDAVRNVSYRGGEVEKAIVEEALIIAALCKDKVFLKQLKHKAIAFKWLKESDENQEVIEEWEIDQLSNQLNHIFPFHTRFPETRGEENITLPFLAMDDTTLDMRMDYQSPDRKRKIEMLDEQTKTWSQLRICITKNDHEQLKVLLDAGASVDQLDKGNVALILVAIQQAGQSGQFECLNVLLQYPHKKETLNAITEKKKLSPLHCAIEYCLPEVVEKLLVMGANPNLRADVDNLSPLYYAMGRYHFLKHQKTVIQQLSRQKCNLHQQDALQRFGVSTAGVFGENAPLCDIDEEAAKRILEPLINAESHGDTLQMTTIIDHLLKHGADPNAKHDNPQNGVKGRTPLMSAIESNAGELFSLMLEHGGDVEQRDGDGFNCLKLAIEFGASEIVKRIC